MKSADNDKSFSQEIQLIGLILSAIGAILQLIGYYEEVQKDAE